MRGVIWKCIVDVVLVVLLVVVAFYSGRYYQYGHTLSQKELGDSIVYRVERPLPVYERSLGVLDGLKRVSIELPELRLVDTVRVVDSVYVRVDTLALLEDYFKERGYELHFGSDSTGIFDVECVVSLNRLQSYSATVVPVVRSVRAPEVVSSRRSVLTPWAMVGCSTDLGVQSLTVGLDVNRFKVGVGGVLVDKRAHLMVNAGVNF